MKFADHAGTPGVPAGFQMAVIAHLVKVADPTAPATTTAATAPLQPSTMPATVVDGVKLLYFAKYNTDVDIGRIQAAAEAVKVRLCIPNAAVTDGLAW